MTLFLSLLGELNSQAQRLFGLGFFTLVCYIWQMLVAKEALGPSWYNTAILGKEVEGVQCRREHKCVATLLDTLTTCEG